MKKLILPIIISIFILFSPSNILAQSSTDCWPTHMIRQYAECSPPHTACLKECSFLDTTPKRKVCFEECGRVNKLCTDKAVADYRVCVVGQTGQSSKPPTSSPSPQVETVVPTSTSVSEPTDQPKDTPPVKDESPILDLLGVNPYELWLRLLTWSNAPLLLAWPTEMNTSEIVDLYYPDDGTIRVEIDSSSVFPANPGMTATGNTSGAQIRTGGQSEYQNLKPNQDIPDGASIKINKSTRFDIGNGDNQIEVQPVGQTGWAEFQIQKSKKNESIDIIESIGTKVIVRPSADFGTQSSPEITNEVETDAWKMPAPAREKLIDVPGVENTKKYSWDNDSEAIIKSNDWGKIEFKDSTVKLKEGEMEVRVRNDNPTENKFKVDADGFFDLMVVQTHFFVSYDPDTKKGAVVVYEGEVEVKTNDGKVVKVKPDGDEPGVVVLSQKLSVVKLAVFGLVLVAVFGGVIFILRKRFFSKSFKKKK